MAQLGRDRNDPGRCGCVTASLLRGARAARGLRAAYSTARAAPGRAAVWVPLVVGYADQSGGGSAGAVAPGRRGPLRVAASQAGLASRAAPGVAPAAHGGRWL